jgi:ribosomal protein L13
MLISFCHHIIIINLSPVLFSKKKKRKKVYIIEHDRPRCHNCYFGYREIKSPRNCLEAGKRET